MKATHMYICGAIMLVALWLGAIRPLQHARSGGSGNFRGVIGGIRVDHHDVIAERQRGQAITDTVCLVKRDNAG